MSTIRRCTTGRPGWRCALFHSEASLVVRLPAILFFAGSTWLMYRLTARLFGARAGLWAATALNIAPVFTLAHASWVLPDGPLMFFMLATVNVVAAILFEEPQVRRPLLWWLAAGVLGGLALLSKYTGVFVFVGVLALHADRAERAAPAVDAGAVAGRAWSLRSSSRRCSSGTCSMAMSACRSRRGGCRAAADIHPLWFLEFLGGQALYLFPLLFVPFAMALWRALRAGRREPRGWLIALIAAGPILLFNVVSLWAHSQPHWPMPGWVFTIRAVRPRRSAAGRGAAALRPALHGVVGGNRRRAAGGAHLADDARRADSGLGGSARRRHPRSSRLARTEAGACGARPARAGCGRRLADLDVCRQGELCAGAGHSGRLRLRRPAAVPLSLRPEPMERPRHAGDRAGRCRQPAPMGRCGALSSTGSTRCPPIAIRRAGRTALVLDVRMGRNLHFPPP